jgi:hypothetical protein
MPVHLAGTRRLSFTFKKAMFSSEWCVAMREYPDSIDHLYSNNEHQWLCGISVAMPLQPTYWS